MTLPTLGINDVLNKKAFWSEFAKKNSGELKVINTKSHDFAKLQLLIDYQGASVLFYETDTKPFKVTIDIPEYPHNVKFLLTTSDFSDKIFSFIVKNKIKTNSSKFNQSYLLKGENSSIVKSLFNDPKIQEAILREDIMMIKGLKSNNIFHVEMAVGANIDQKEKLDTVWLLSKMFIEKL